MFSREGDDDISRILDERFCLYDRKVGWCLSLAHGKGKWRLMFLMLEAPREGHGKCICLIRLSVLA